MPLPGNDRVVGMDGQRHKKSQIDITPHARFGIAVVSQPANLGRLTRARISRFDRQKRVRVGERGRVERGKERKRERGGEREGERERLGGQDG